MLHDLKTWPESFQAIWDSRKHAEFRRSDRPYYYGDTLQLREYNPDTNSYTGRAIFAAVTDVCRGGQFGIPEEFCMMSLGEMTRCGNVELAEGSLR